MEETKTVKKPKKIKKPKNFIEEISFMVSIDGIKRRAVMREIEYETDLSKPQSVGTIKWKSFTFTANGDPDNMMYSDYVEANNRNIFQAIYKHLREKQHELRNRAAHS